MKTILQFSVLALVMLAACSKKPSSISYSLDSTTKGWATDSTAGIVIEFTQGHYSIRLNDANALIFAAAPYSNLNFPYTVQVDAITELEDTAGGKIGSCDIIFNHVDTANYSRVEVWTNGDYRILTKTNSVFSTVADFTAFGSIQAGVDKTNTIKIVQNATNMQLYINGVIVNTYTIPIPSSLITVGIGVTTANAYFTPTTGLFNNFSLSKN